MSNVLTRPEAAPNQHGAHASVRVGNAVVLEARISTKGLLAVAAIVTSAVLGSAAIVLAARHGRDAPRPLPDDRQR
ncbi:hypothetical protein [uncultured Sphingomonas sp.]|uniref:hypothetical protein n=1 Tax=uncultured Sphingomonas sp. TaxID=158754 RepID=UPI0025F493BE|nr:hypothetical protein [uncultured Sphingomonas sp.]